MSLWSDRTAALHTLWLLVALALAAVWIDYSRFHEALVADALIPVLSSLYSWEPFFWEQTRIGTLAPLLAIPISNPWYNLLFQTWISIAAGLTLLVLLVRYVDPQPGWQQVALINLALFLLVAPQDTRYVLLSTQVTYGAALSLGIAALLVLRGNRRRSIAVALLLSVIAHWLNGATALLLVPLELFRSFLRPREGRGKVGVLILMAGFAIGQLLAAVSPYPLWHLQVLDPMFWPEAWTRMAVSTWNEVKGPWSILLVSSCAISLTIECRGGRKCRGLSLTLPLVLSAVVYWLLLGASEWVKLNHYHPRYAMPAMLCLHTAAVTAALRPLARWTSMWSSPRGRVTVSLLLAVSIAYNYGLPSPARAREIADRRLGALSEDVRAGGVTHLLGSYGTVWTTMFHTNLLRYEANRPGLLWGITHRAGPTARFWMAIPREQWRIGVRSGDPSWREIAKLYQLPELILVDRAGSLLIYEPDK